MKIKQMKKRQKENKRTYDLKVIPENLKTRERCEKAVEIDAINLAYVPDKYKTYSLCQKAVVKNGLTLVHVPRALRDIDLCLNAIENDMDALEHVPKRIKEEVLLEFDLLTDSIVCQYEDEANYDLNCLDSINLFEDWESFILNNPHRINEVPSGMITRELALSLVERFPWMLENFPENLKIPNVCIIAVRRDESAMKFVPNRFKEFVSKEVFDTIDDI